MRNGTNSFGTVPGRVPETVDGCTGDVRAHENNSHVAMKGTACDDTMQLSGRAFLAALRLSDSALPTGLFTQSHGLETFVHSGRVQTPKDVARLVGNVLKEQTAPTDGVATAWAWRAAAAGNVALFTTADRALHATKLCRELREGSQRSGGRLLRLGETLTHRDVMFSIGTCIKEGETPGHYATVFGALCACLDISLDITVQMELHSMAMSLLWAAMRLVRFDHMDAQKTLTQLEPVILEATEMACRRDVNDMRSLAFMTEIMAMHHERSHIRMFSS